MNQFIISICLLTLFFELSAQNHNTIQLNPPDKNRGVSVMQALAQRASATDFDTTDISIKDLSDLLWAANGINRIDQSRRTASSAMNSQDIDVFIANKHAVYLYNHIKHSLEKQIDGDYRKQIAGRQEHFAKAPLMILLISDLSRFSRGEQSQKLNWAAIDAGMVAQNILLFCSSEGLAARPRVTMERDQLIEILQLNEFQEIILNIPISYIK